MTTEAISESARHFSDLFSSIGAVRDETSEDWPEVRVTIEAITQYTGRFSDFLLRIRD